MPSRITTLTDEQWAAIPAHVERWVEVGLSTDEVDEVGWGRFERGVEACYGFAGVAWHGRVVRVGSPFVAASAATAAARLLAAPGPVADGAVYGAVSRAVFGAVSGAVFDAVDRPMGGQVAD